MQDFSPIKRNITKYLEFKGVSKYEFYKNSKITRGILDQPNGINEDNIAKFLAYAQDINPEWLLTGEGSMLSDGSGNYRQKRLAKKLTDAPSDIPVYAGNMQGGIVHVFNDDPESGTPIGTLSPMIFKDCDHAEVISGDSMYPIICNQGIAVGRKVQKEGIIYGEKYGIHTRHGMKAAKFVHAGSKKELLKLVSHNSHIPPQEILLDDVTFCFHIRYVINPS